MLEHVRGSRETFRGLTGSDRYLAYAVAFQSGFRVGREMATLTPRSFDLDAAVVRVPAAYTKNRDEATQPIPAPLAEALRSFLAGKSPERPQWPETWHLCGGTFAA